MPVIWRYGQILTHRPLPSPGRWFQKWGGDLAITASNEYWILVEQASKERRIGLHAGTAHCLGLPLSLDQVALLCAPLIYAEAVVGVLTLVRHTSAEPFCPEDGKRIGLATPLVASAVHAAILEEKVRQQNHLGKQMEEQIKSMLWLSQRLLHLSDPQSILDRVMDSVQELYAPDSAHILILNQTQTRLVQVSGRQDGLANADPVNFLSIDAKTLASHVVRTGHPARVVDYSRDSRFSLPPWLAEKPITSSMSIPLRAGDQAVGVLSIFHYQAREYGSGEMQVLGVLAHVIGGALERVRLRQNELTARQEAERLKIVEQRRIRELETLASLTAALRQARTADELVPIFLQQTGASIQSDLCAIFRLEAKQDSLVLWDMRSSRPSDNLPDLSTETGLARVALDTGEISYLSRIRVPSRRVLGGNKIPASLEESEEAKSLTPEELAWVGREQGAAFVPLRTSQGKQVGLLLVLLKPDIHLTDEDRHLLQAISEVAGNALNRASTMDLLEQRVAERTRELTEANLRLQEADRIKSHFIAELSQEIRVPATNVSLYTRLIQLGNAEKQPQYLQMLDTETRRLLKVIEDVLDLDRLKEAVELPTFDDLDLNSLTEDLVKANQPTAQDRGLTMSFHPESDLPRIWGEAHILRQAATHLITNAIHSTPQGAIHISTFANHSRVCLQVQDTGVGMSQDEQARLFDPFYRGATNRYGPTVGSGLGLSKVKEIVQLHGGEIIVQSQLGQGSTFQIWLPVWPKA